MTLDIFDLNMGLNRIKNNTATPSSSSSSSSSTSTSNTSSDVNSPSEKTKSKNKDKDKGKDKDKESSKNDDKNDEKKNNSNGNKKTVENNNTGKGREKGTEKGREKGSGVGGNKTVRRGKEHVDEYIQATYLLDEGTCCYNTHTARHDTMFCHDMLFLALSCLACISFIHLLHSPYPPLLPPSPLYFIYTFSSHFPPHPHFGPLPSPSSALPSPLPLHPLLYPLPYLLCPTLLYSDLMVWVHENWRKYAYRHILGLINLVLNSPSIMHMANTSKRFKEAVQVRVLWCDVV